LKHLVPAIARQHFLLLKTIHYYYFFFLPFFFFFFFLPSFGRRGFLSPLSFTSAV
jgi:hypothetical protein